MTVKELRDLLDEFGDHLEVAINTGRGELRLIQDENALRVRDDGHLVIDVSE